MIQGWQVAHHLTFDMKYRAKRGDRVYIENLEAFGIVKKVRNDGLILEAEVKQLQGNMPVPTIINVAGMVVEIAVLVYKNRDKFINLWKYIKELF